MMAPRAAQGAPSGWVVQNSMVSGHAARISTGGPQPSYHCRVGHPFRALFTAVTISSTVICKSWLAFPLSHIVSGALPSAMFTSVRSSSTVTRRSVLQSPTHTVGAGVGVTVGVLVGVRVPALVTVAVGLGVACLKVGWR